MWWHFLHRRRKYHIFTRRRCNMHLGHWNEIGHGFELDVWQIQNGRIGRLHTQFSNGILHDTFILIKYIVTNKFLFNFQIHDGENIADRVIGKYCGFNLPHNGSIISTKNSLYLRYESNSTNVHNNFSFNWVSIPPVCGGNFIYKSHGSISSPGSPGKYPVNRDCFWTVTAPPGKKIMLNFFTLQIKSDINCSTDYLEVIYKISFYQFEY